MYGLAAGTAQGHIAVLLPSVRVQREETQQINRGLKHIEQAVLSHVVEAVLGSAALHIDLEGFALAVCAPLMGVPGNALLVCPHKDTVVILGVLVQQSGPDKVGDHLPADVPLLHQVGVHTAHIGVGRRQGEGPGRLLPLWLRGGICLPQLFSQQELHGLLIGCPVVVLDKADRMAALPGNMVVPFVAPDGDMVHPGQPGLPPGAAQFLPPLPQEFLQINGVGPLLLFIGKMDIGSHAGSPRIKRLTFVYTLYILSLKGRCRSCTRRSKNGATARACGSPRPSWTQLV